MNEQHTPEQWRVEPTAQVFAGAELIADCRRWFGSTDEALAAIKEKP